MTFARVALASVGALFAAAQTATTGGSISGTAREAHAGAAMAEVAVTLSAVKWADGAFAVDESFKPLTTTTDQRGRYGFRGLPPHLYLVDVRESRRYIELKSGEDLAKVDFRITGHGAISGMVLDENGEAVANAEVRLLEREYDAGILRVITRAQTRADSRGAYRMASVEAGRAFLIATTAPKTSIEAASKAPSDRGARARIQVPTYFPKALTAETAEPLMLRPGENRENVDFRLASALPYCLEGVLEGATDFELQETEFLSSGGRVASAPGGKTGWDGKVRVCDLHVGDYRLLASAGGSAASVPLTATAMIAVRGADIMNFRLAVHPPVSLSGEMVWDGPPPSATAGHTITIALRPLYGMATKLRQNRGGMGAHSTVPGSFSLTGLLRGDYSARVDGLSGHYYVKDILYGAESVLHRPLRLADGRSGRELRVIVGQNGGGLEVLARDKDGDPRPGASVAVFALGAASEEEMARSMRSGSADERGRYDLEGLPPGRYLVLATESRLATGGPGAERPAEEVARIWKARGSARTVEIGPRTTVQVKLQTVGME